MVLRRSSYKKCSRYCSSTGCDKWYGHWRTYSVPKPDQSYETLMKRTLKNARCLLQRSPFRRDTHPDNIAALEHTFTPQNWDTQLSKQSPTLIRKSYEPTLLLYRCWTCIRQMEDKLQRRIAESELEMPSWVPQQSQKRFRSEYSWHVDKIFSESRKSHIFEEYDLVTPTAACPPVEWVLGWVDEKNYRFLRRFPIRKLIDMAIEQLATNL